MASLYLAHPNHPPFPPIDHHSVAVHEPKLTYNSEVHTTTRPPERRWYPTIFLRDMGALGQGRSHPLIPPTHSSESSTSGTTRRLTINGMAKGMS